MNLKLHWLFVASFTLISGVAVSQSRYVSTTGTDASNDCQSPGNPCSTIGHAYTQISAGDSIKVAPGTYNLTTTLNLNQSVVLTALSPSNKPVITSSVADVINVNSDDVTISNLDFQMGLTATSGLRGIVSIQNFNALRILNNTFESTNPISGTPNTNMVWGAFAISLVSDAGDVQNVEIRDNEIIAGSTANIFGRGIFIGNGGTGKDAPGGIIDGNDITAYYTIQSARLANFLMISNNGLNGITMINTPINGTQVLVNNNVFSGNTQMTPASLYSLVELRSVNDGSVTLTNNTFEDYSTIGLLSEASQNVTVSNNTFNPSATATDFISLMVNTKLMTNGTQGSTYSDEIEIKGNTFNAGAANVGSAIVFADHYGVNTPAFGTVTIGGVSLEEKNIFNADLAKYIVLDGNSGASTTYPLWTGYSSTTMKTVSQDFTALANHNNYNLVDFTAIDGKMTDVATNTNLGEIVIKSAGNIRYVAMNGTDNSNDCAFAGSPCATILHALDLSVDEDTIQVAGGSYFQTEILNITQNNLTIRGENLEHKPTLTTFETTIFDVDASGVNLNGLKLELGLTATTGKYGIVSTTGNFNNISIKNNEFLSTAALTAYGMNWDAFAVRLFSNVGAIDTVLISDNTIGSANAANNVFGRGIALGSGSSDGPSGTILNNDIVAYYAIQAIRSTGDIAISDNEIHGITMINAPLTGSDIQFSSNLVDAVMEMSADSLYALLEIRSVETGSVFVSNNDFTNYKNIGLLSTGSKNVTVSENVFSPATTADNFISLMANTKIMTNSVQGNTYGDEITIVGNEFEAGVAEEGTAIVFADHYGAVTPAFTAITVGGPVAAEKNVFNTDLGNFIVLDDKSGSSETVTLWAPYSETTMKPFSQDVIALYDNNTYNFATVTEIENKNIDSLDNDILGKVILGTTVGLNDVTMETVKLFPNPTADQITVELLSGNTAEVTIVDVLGNVVLTTNVAGTKTINVQNLTAGVYVVRLNNNSATRFVKQ